MARVVEGCQATGTWERPATPQVFASRVYGKVFASLVYRSLLRVCTACCMCTARCSLVIKQSGGLIDTKARQMQKVGDEWVSKGWNECEHKGWLFKAVSRPPIKADSASETALRDELASASASYPMGLVCDLATS